MDLVWQALSGRLRRGRGCEVQGKITYNGDTADAKLFRYMILILERVAAYYLYYPLFMF